MRQAYGVLPWGIILLGAVHMVATPSRFETFNASALWFFSGGIVLLLTGSLNLLNRAYGASAPGLLWVCRITNVGMLAFCGVGGVVTHGTLAELVVVPGLMGAMTVLSWMRPRQMADGQAP
jgi:hypothetical protein